MQDIILNCIVVKDFNLSIPTQLLFNADVLDRKPSSPNRTANQSSVTSNRRDVFIDQKFHEDIGSQHYKDKLPLREKGDERIELGKQHRLVKKNSHA